jgi:hypothetical protein
MPFLLLPAMLPARSGPGAQVFDGTSAGVLNDFAKRAKENSLVWQIAVF